MLTLNVKGDVKAILRDLDDLKRRRVPAATARALNKTATAVRAEAVRQIRQERALPAATVRNALAIQRADKSRLTAQVIATGRPIPLRDYAARQTRPGVTVRVTPQGGRKVVRVAGHGSFIVSRIGGHVFVRQGARRLPIRKLFGPSIPSAFIKAAVMRAIDQVGHDAWPKRFAEEIAYELSR